MTRFVWGAVASMAKACRKAAGFLLLGVAALSLAGCMEIETVVRVNPDGSGTITERLVMSNEIVEMMSGNGARRAAGRTLQRTGTA